MTFDPVPVVMDALKTQFPGVKVFGGAIPKDENGTPLMLVRTIVRRPATAPTTQWWLHACRLTYTARTRLRVFSWRLMRNWPLTRL